MTRRNDTTIPQILSLGVTLDDAHALRRISMTLRRWHGLECGDSDDYASRVIERSGDEPDSAPYFVIRPHKSNKPIRHRIPDRETGARKRLAKIMERYQGLRPYVQGDPRGCALYLLRPGDVPAGEDDGAYYSRGIAVY